MNKVNKYIDTEKYEVIDIKVEEEKYDLNDSEIEDDKIIKYEFNIIELPIFSKDKRVEIGIAKKYIFSERDNSYVTIIPSGSPFVKSNKILQEFDEKVFYGIMRLSKIQNSKEVITDYFTLSSYSKTHYKHLERLKDSIERLKECTIVINNSFYNAEERRGYQTQKINILQSTRILTFDECIKLEKKDKDKYSRYFRNSKIKEILVLTLNDFMYKNIESKGYLHFDSEKLLAIENSTTRKMYILLMKWQGYEKTISIVRTCRFLASHIPLSWTSTNRPSTIRAILTSCRNLKDSGLLKNFSFEKTKPLENSKIEFIFFTEHDHDELKNDKEKLIYKNNQKLSAKTGHEHLEISKVVEGEIIFQEEIKELTNEQKNKIIKICENSNKLSSDIAIELFKEYKEENIEYLTFCLQKSISKEKPFAYFSKIVTEISNKLEYKNSLEKHKIKKNIENKQLHLFEEELEIDKKIMDECNRIYNELSSEEYSELEQKYEKMPEMVKKITSKERLIKDFIKKKYFNI